MQTFPHCSGACQQGRRFCPHPMSCSLPDDCRPDGDDDLGFARGLLVASAITACCIVFGLMLAYAA